MNELLVLLLGAGGAGGIAGLVNVYLSIRAGKTSREETLIGRLNAETTRAAERADQAEKETDAMRMQRDRARELLAIYRMKLIGYGEQLPPLEDLYR